MSRQVLTRSLAALFTPLAVLASAHELYLRNQEEFGAASNVLFPFWVTAGLTVLLALALQAAGRRPLAGAALAAVYTLGFGFVVWTFLRALPAGAHLLRWVLDTGAGAAAFAVLLFLGGVAAARRWPARSWEPLLAAVALLLLVREASLFATRLERRPPPLPRDLAREFGPSRNVARPNVYHFILDSFQDELLEPCLPPGAGDVLEGFVRFHVTTPAWSTATVLPDVLTGRAMSGPRPPGLAEALAGETSLLRRLESAGYRTIGFVPRFIYGKHPTALDVTALHEETVPEPDLPGLHRALFLRVWAFGTLPRSAGEALARGRILGVESDFFRMASVQKLSGYAPPLLSRVSLEKVAEIEPRLPPSGRYTLVHVLLPHAPFVLRSDCRPGFEGTDLKAQTDCTMALVVRFLERLRDLGRLDPSIVVVQGDHGSGQAWREGRLVPDDSAWYRTMLLVKPAGARGPLRASPSRARLVDVVPTLAALVGMPPGGEDGRPLEDAAASPAQPMVLSDRAGTPATRVRAGTSAVTTLPAATND